MPEAHIYTEDELRELLKEWQEVLWLRDWDVKVGIYRQEDFDHKTGQGEITWILPKKQAVIKIVDPIDYPKVQWAQDMERTLVHELNHLHFAPFDNADEGSANDISQEQAIDALAKALVTLKRSKFVEVLK